MQPASLFPISVPFLRKGAAGSRYPRSFIGLPHSRYMAVRQHFADGPHLISIGRESNESTGQGRMEIIESTPASNVVIKIDFIQPFEGHNTIEFTLERQGDAAKVTQAMYGPSPFVSKLVGLFCSMDKMVGQKFEEGLAGMKAIAEK